MNEQQIEATIQRTRRYWYDDGLTEIAVGTIFLLVSAVFALETVAPPGSSLQGVAALGIVVVVIAGGWGTRWAIQRLKEKYIYPRTGFVAYPRTKSKARSLAVGALAGAIGAAVAGLAASGQLDEAWLPLFQGLVVAGAFLYWGQTLGLWRFLALAAASAGIGLVAMLSGLEGDPAAALYFAGTGLAMIVSGASALAAYFRRTRALEEE